MKEDQQHIDDLNVREGLNNLRPSAPAGSWDQLAQRMDAAAHFTDGDDLLRDKLNGIQPTFSASSWEALNHRLNNEESDDILATKIDTHAPVPPVSGWAALAAKLELIAARRAAIYSYKFSELCLVMAALLLFWYTVPEVITVPNTAFDAPVPVAQLETSSHSSSLTQPVATHNAPLVDAQTTEDEIDYAEVAATLPLAPRPILLDFTIPTTILPVAEVIEATETMPAIEAVPTLAYELPIEEGPLPNRPLGSITRAKKTPKTLYLRPFISPWDFNQVITPKQAVNDIIIERDDRISYGNSAGILLDVQYRKHAMQYGIIYSHRSYIPTVLKEVEDFVPGQGPIERRDTNYSRITFQTVSLPVSFQRELFKNDRWRFAASVGLAVNLNIWSTFRKSPTFDQDVLNWTRQTPQPIAAGRESNNNLPVINARDLVYPEQGLLQGGSLLDNMHLSASFGFSIERYLSDRMSFYVAPRFSRSFYHFGESGVEPFNDRIHNSSVQFGTRILLGTRN